MAANPMYCLQHGYYEVGDFRDLTHYDVYVYAYSIVVRCTKLRVRRERESCAEDANSRG